MVNELGPEQHPCRNCINVSRAVAILVHDAEAKGAHLSDSQIEDFIADFANDCPGYVSAPVTSDEEVIDLTDGAPQIVFCGMQSEIDFLQGVALRAEQFGAA